MEILRCSMCGAEYNKESVMCESCGFPVNDENRICLINGREVDLQFILDEVNQPIRAIKMLKDKSGIQLREAKFLVEKIQATNRIPRKYSTSDIIESGDPTGKAKFFPKCPRCESVNIESNVKIDNPPSSFFGLIKKKPKNTRRCNDCGEIWFK